MGTLLEPHNPAGLGFSAKAAPELAFNLEDPAFSGDYFR